MELNIDGIEEIMLDPRYAEIVLSVRSDEEGRFFATIKGDNKTLLTVKDSSLRRVLRALQEKAFDILDEGDSEPEEEYPGDDYEDNSED